MKTRVAKVMVGMGLAGALATAGCQSLGMGNNKGESFPLQVSGDIPAAQGQLNVKQEKSGNQELQLTVEHLAPAELARPGATVYVVWLTPQGSDQPTNAGVLPVDQDRKGEFKTVTPFKAFEVTVTPERNATVREPSKKPVLRAAVAPAGRIM
jgi:hypothetical protein